MNYGNYPDLSSVKKILVIKMRHHGDVLLTSPLFSVLQSHLPNARIDAYVYADTVPMLDGHPAIVKFFGYDRKWKKLSFFGKFAKEFSLLKEIRKEGYDLVINLTEGDRGAIAALYSGSPLRVGFDPGTGGFIGKRKTFTHLAKNFSGSRHTVERNLDVLRKIGIFPSEEERDLFLDIPSAVMQKMKEDLQKQGITGPYVLIHPTSRWRFKCLPMEKISKLIEMLHKKGVKVVLTSGPDAVEKAMIEEILKPISHISVGNFSGKTTLKELAALVKLAKMLVCVDSVPLHIASAVKTPVVTVFGPTSDLNWGPWMHKASRVVKKNLPCQPCNLDGCAGSKKSDCLLTLPVEQIYKACEELGL
ncbi:MAG: putative lipopolysaccharide heptosyltransferase III [Chlamydiae bacterium]|nr:putative lipopolysaccharide heptosyltransferase III [Chlamydiota bacterium]